MPTARKRWVHVWRQLPILAWSILQYDSAEQLLEVQMLEVVDQVSHPPSSDRDNGAYNQERTAADPNNDCYLWH